LLVFQLQRVEKIRFSFCLAFAAIAANLDLILAVAPGLSLIGCVQPSLVSSHQSSTHPDDRSQRVFLTCSRSQGAQLIIRLRQLLAWLVAQRKYPSHKPYLLSTPSVTFSGWESDHIKITRLSLRAVIRKEIVLLSP
jgi:hypothetical protein